MTSLSLNDVRCDKVQTQGGGAGHAWTGQSELDLSSSDPNLEIISGPRLHLNIHIAKYGDDRY